MNAKMQEISGSINYYAGMWFKMFHHEPFSFNAKKGKMEYNNNPLGDDRFMQIENFSLQDDGFSFVKIDKKKKQMIVCQDETTWEKTLTKYLHSYMNYFNFSEEDVKGTAFNVLWSPTGATNVTFRPRNRNSLTFRRIDGKLYIESCNLTERILVANVYFKTEGIVIYTSQGDIDYEFKIQPDIWIFIKSVFEIGFSDLLNVRNNV
jgi:hypothetical protein